LSPILYEDSYAPESRDRYGEWWTDQVHGVTYLFGNQLVEYLKHACIQNKTNVFKRQLGPETGKSAVNWE
jgi:hypothetical protein